MHAPVPSLIPPELLLSAYRQGIFPMADARDDTEVFWVEPRVRAILPIGGFHLSRTLARMVRRDRFTLTCDTAFREVVEACAQRRADADGTWISRRIQSSYAALHDAGHAHSIECWEEDELVGGVYGVAFDRVFCGESMFSRRDNASKVALAWLMALLERAGCALFDCQFMTAHLRTLGAESLPQSDYLKRLERARGEQPMTLPEAYSSLSSEAGADPDSSPGKLIAQSLTHTS